MLTILLVDAELERVPASITGHPQVGTSAKKAGTRAGRMLLDASLHHAAMRKLEDAGRRGRPDLIHVFLLTALESPVNHAGHLRILVHTRENYLLRIDPTTRLVRNFNRFCGLIEQLFETGKVPPEAPLLTLEPNWTPAAIADLVHPDRTVILDETGTRTNPWDVFGPADAARNVLAIVGGFPSGSYRSPLPPGERVGFGARLLTVWTVAAELLMNYERQLPPEALERATRAAEPRRGPPPPPRAA